MDLPLRADHFRTTPTPSPSRQVDVHARDVVQRMIEERVESGQCFQWQSQLRYQQNEKTKECQVCGERGSHRTSELPM